MLCVCVVCECVCVFVTQATHLNEGKHNHLQHLRETSKENARLVEKHSSQQKHIACCEANEINLKQGW